ncbi:MAG: hypothetical protein FWD71_14900 [Oscillospiraceae bacterium]|nr:hypothetical protein [Oscillospiraceae bacterium]
MDKTENIILVSHGVTLSVWQSVWLGEEIQPFKIFGINRRRVILQIKR